MANQVRTIVLFVVFGLGAYANALFHPFVHDDIVFIRYNPSIDDLSQPLDIFLNPTIPRPDSSVVNTYYRPLLELIYRLEYRLFGFHTTGYHVVNILLHIANSILVWALLSVMQRPQFVAMTVAGLFLIHPVQTESVAYVSGISDLVFVFLCLLSFILYLQSDRPRQAWLNLILYAAALVGFGMALLAKEQSVVLPFLIILFGSVGKYKPFLTAENSFPPQQRRYDDRREECSWGCLPSQAKFPRRFLRVGGFFIMLGGYLMWRGMIFPQATPAILTDPREFALRIFVIPRILLTYIRIVFFPVDLHFYRTTDILEKSFWPGVGLTLLIFSLIWLVRRRPLRNRHPQLLFGLGWFFVAILPTVNIIPVFVEYSFVWTVDHFLYLPIIGVFIFVLEILHSAGKDTPFLTAENSFPPLQRRYDDRREEFSGDDWQRCSARGQKKNITVALVAVGLILLGMTIHQNTYWASEISLFKRAIQFEGHLGRLHRLLAQAYYFQGQFQKAKGHYARALAVMQQYLHEGQAVEIKQFYLGFIKGLHFDIAHCYEALGDTQAAIAHYQEAVVIDPLDSVLYNDLGVQFLNVDSTKPAMAQFQKALELNPNNLMAMSNLAVCYIQEGNRQEAERLLRKALEIDGHFTSARQNLEKLLKSN